MNRSTDEMKALATGLKAARGATVDMTAQLRKLLRQSTKTSSRTGAACPGESCSPDTAGGRSGTGADPQSGLSSAAGLPSALSRSLERGASRLLSTSLASVLKSSLSNFSRSLASMVTRQAGGGLLGGLAGNLVGGGLNMLLGGLFKRRQAVRVENTVQTEVLNFPQYSDLGLATNPASRLLGGRSVPRGPAFSVTVDYRSGAEEIITAKVADKLADLNELHGVY